MTKLDKQPRPLKVCITQMSSSPDISVNLTHCKQLIEAASKQGNQLIIFPECALIWAKTEITHELAKTQAEWVQLLSKEAKEQSIAIIWGGLAERDGEQVFNTSFIFDKSGTLLGLYRKTHLFQIFASDSVNVDETATYTHGNTGPVTVNIEGWSIGISICYDLRFPEFLRSYAGCDLIVNTAAFTRRTGRAHWEVLMRARAIENQCFVLGSAQCGLNKLSGFSAYGHSIAIDPWGKILGELEGEPGSFNTELDHSDIIKNRNLVPALYTSFPNLRER